MNYRNALLLAAEDLGEAGTKVIDLDVSKPISSIEMTYKTTKGAQGMNAASPANIAKIELVSGSTPFHSLTGYENQALAYYSRPGRVMDHGQHVNALSEVDVYALDFGRWLWDEQLAFDPTRFTNPQLRVTYDEDVADISAGGGTLEVWAHIFDEKLVNPIGFLSAIEHHDYTCGDENSYQTIELPEDRVVRQMLVRAFTDAFEPWYTIDEARLDEGTLDRIPWSFTDLEMYYRRMKSQWPPIIQQLVVAPTTAGKNFYTAFTDYNAVMSFLGMGGTTEMYLTAASGRGGKFALDVSVTVNVAAIGMGYLPWHCYQFPMGLKDVIEDWYNPAGKKPRLRLRAGASGTGGTGQVVLEELYRY